MTGPPIIAREAGWRTPIDLLAGRAFTAESTNSSPYVSLYRHHLARGPLSYAKTRPVALPNDKHAGRFHVRRVIDGRGQTRHGGGVNTGFASAGDVGGVENAAAHRHGIKAFLACRRSPRKMLSAFAAR